LAICGPQNFFGNRLGKQSKVNFSQLNNQLHFNTQTVFFIVVFVVVVWKNLWQKFHLKSEKFAEQLSLQNLCK